VLFFSCYCYLFHEIASKTPSALQFVSFNVVSARHLRRIRRRARLTHQRVRSIRRAHRNTLQRVPPTPRPPEEELPATRHHTGELFVICLLHPRLYISFGYS
jgi:hypothetical protein